MEKRSINITLETAKQMHQSQDADIRNLALAAYPELEEPKYPELEEPKYPKWDELPSIQGYYVDTSGKIKISTSTDRAFNYENKNVWPTKELAKAALALSQLLQLRDAYNNISLNEEPDLSFIYINTYGDLISRRKGNSYKKLYPLEFKYPTTSYKFLENNRELLEIAKPLL